VWSLAARPQQQNVKAGVAVEAVEVVGAEAEADWLYWLPWKMIHRHRRRSRPSTHIATPDTTAYSFA